MKININVKRRFKVNGKEYSSIEEMPDDIREAFEKAMASQSRTGHQANPATMQSKIIFNNMEYENIDAMTQDIRQLYKKVMTAAETGTVPADLNLAGDSKGLLTGLKDSSTARAGESRHPTKAESSFSPRTLVASVLLVAFILLLYYLFHGR